MSSPEFVVSVLRLGLLIVPVGVTAHVLRRRFSAVTGAMAVVLEVIVAVAWLVVLAEGLGLVHELRLGWLVIASWLGAATTMGLLRLLGSSEADAVDVARPVELVGPARSWSAPVAAGVVLWLVISQWVFETANALGSGMTSFDSLWYHMPIAAGFAQSGSVTKILFPEADPSNAYFPANSELLHALGIITFGNDFLSLFLNLGWLALGLIAFWCVGTRWRAQCWTLCFGAVLFLLPVLGTNEPGQALNDIPGLALLACAVALILTPRLGWPELGVAALALGLAIGTKWTFVVPAIVLAAAVIWLQRRRSPVRVTATMVGPMVLTGGWWYLRDLIDTGNPLGLSLNIGPIHLPGAVSPISTASKQSVSSVIGRSSVWSSRLTPGLNHALGPLWPLLLAALLGSVILAGVTARREPVLAALALVTVAAAVAYVFTPATAQNINHTSSYFTYDVRFLAPALELGLLGLAAIIAARTPRLLPLTACVLIVIALSAQLEHNGWPTQSTGHLAALAVTAILGAVLLLATRRGNAAKPVTRALITAGLALAVLVTGDLVEHHYLDRRYLGDNSALGQIYRWAQTVNHTHIALYGTVLQYPLYGATDSNTVTYLGQPAAHDGYQPIADCPDFQHAIQTQDFHYLVLTPGPTGEIPQTWTQTDRNLIPIMHTAHGDWVYKIVQGNPGASCS